jgi:hypothetical protein
MSLSMWMMTCGLNLGLHALNPTPQNMALLNTFLQQKLACQTTEKAADCAAMLATCKAQMTAPMPPAPKCGI